MEPDFKVYFRDLTQISEEYLKLFYKSLGLRLLENAPGVLYSSAYRSTPEKVNYEFSRFRTKEEDVYRIVSLSRDQFLEYLNLLELFNTPLRSYLINNLN